MISNEELYLRLKSKLIKINLKKEEEKKIVSELNYLSGLLIDNYLYKKNV